MVKAAHTQKPGAKSRPNDRLVLTNSDGDFVFYYHEIISIEADNSQVYVYVHAAKEQDKKFVFSKKLNEMEALLNAPCFIRVHN